MFGTICKPDEQYNLLTTSFYYFSSLFGGGDILFLSCHNCLSTQLLHFNKFGVYSLLFLYKLVISPKKVMSLGLIQTSCITSISACLLPNGESHIDILKEFLTWNISSECYGHYGDTGTYIYVFPSKSTFNFIHCYTCILSYTYINMW